MSASGRVPNASSARRAVPNRFVTSGNDAPFTRVKSSAGPPAGDHAPMDLGGFLVRIDRHVDHGEIAIAAELIEEGSEIGEGHALNRPKPKANGQWPMADGQRHGNRNGQR